MLDLSALFKRAGKVAAENSPAILTAIGVTGTLSTAYLAAKGAFKSAKDLQEAEGQKYNYDSEGNRREDKSERDMTPEELASRTLTFQEKFEATWQNYIPAATTCAVTIAAIICSHNISERRRAAVASAYAVVKESYGEYRAKTLDKVGKKKEEEIRSEIAQDRIEKHPPSQSTLIVTGVGQTWCRDAWTGQYFVSDMETIRKAVNEFNHALVNSAHPQSLADFHQMIGLPRTPGGEEIGWSTDKLLEVEFVGVLREDGLPCLEMSFKNLPNPRYADYH